MTTARYCLCGHELGVHEAGDGPCWRATCPCIGFMDLEAFKPTIKGIASLLTPQVQVLQQPPKKPASPRRHRRRGEYYCACGHKRAYHHWTGSGVCKFATCACEGYRDRITESPEGASRR